MWRSSGPHDGFLSYPKDSKPYDSILVLSNFNSARLERFLIQSCVCPGQSGQHNRAVAVLTVFFSLIGFGFAVPAMNQISSYPWFGDNAPVLYDARGIKDALGSTHALQLYYRYFFKNHFQKYYVSLYTHPNNVSSGIKSSIQIKPKCDPQGKVLRNGLQSNSSHD